MSELISCPACGNRISSQASSCPQCGHPVASPPAPQVIVTQKVPLWNPGIAALLSFLIPGMGQMYKGQVLNGIVWFVLVGSAYFFGALLLFIPGVILHLCCIVGATMGDPYRN